MGKSSIAVSAKEGGGVRYKKAVVLDKGKSAKAVTNRRIGLSLELRLRGKSYRFIAEALGVRVQTVKSYIERGLSARESENIEGVRRMEGIRLDYMLDKLWDKVEAGDEFAIDKVLKIMDRRSKLYGLDSPIKKEISKTISGSVAVEDKRRILEVALKSLKVTDADIISEDNEGE
tara:strand:+ start:440 stop:964 length:525 start_codon:yes stop_codon:yes gene_type:complete